jgi:uncharacterized membrane protein
MDFRNVPLYFSTDEEIRSAKSPFLTGIKESAKRVYKSAGFNLFKNILLLVVLVFVFISCILNLVAFAKVNDDYSTDRDNYNSYIGNNPTVTPAPPAPVETISEGWLIFGIVFNSMIALVALIGIGIIIWSLVKGNKDNEKGVRKVIKQTVAGTRIKVEEVVENTINKFDIDPDEIEDSKTSLISTLKMRIDNALDRYLGNIAETMDE